MTDEIVTLSRDRIAKGSKSFAAAARLFPPAMRDDACMLYAWCRHCDDVIDGQSLGHGAPSRQPASARAAFLELEQTTRDALSGRASDPVFVALARVVERHGIPSRHPLDLIEGFRMDVEGRRYETIDDTLTYCYHVAGVVGVMMAFVMGVRESAVLERAQDLGLAFQLTNICRDIVEDAGESRVYLPRIWLEEAGVGAGGVADPRNRAAIAEVAQRALDLADRYYLSASNGLSELPFRAAWAVAAAGKVYGGIGHKVRLLEANAWNERAVVGRRGKLAAISLSLGSALLSRTPPAIRRAKPRDPTLWTKGSFTLD